MSCTELFNKILNKQGFLLKLNIKISLQKNGASINKHHDKNIQLVYTFRRNKYYVCENQLF